MKSISIMKRTFIAASIVSALFITSSCDKNNDDVDNTYTVSGNASGSAEVPAVTTSGTATFNAGYDADNNRLNYTINWSGLSGPVTVAHFHGPALPGASAPPIIDIAITTNGVAGNTSASLTIPDSTEQHLLTGKIYYNLHTAAHPAGEVRGQLAATKN